MQGKKGGRENDLFFIVWRREEAKKGRGGKPIFRLFARLFKKGKAPPLSECELC